MEVCWVGQFFIQVFKFSMVIFYEIMYILIYYMKIFLNDFFERVVYRYDFIYRFYVGVNLV